MILTEVAVGQPFSIDPRWRQLSLGGTLLAAVAVSLLDWFTPQVAGIPLLYLVILWTSLWWAARPQVIIVAALASVLTLAIYPAPHAPEWVPDGVGRVVTIIGLWFMVVYGLAYHRTVEHLQRREREFQVFEEVSHEREQFLRATFDAAPVGITIVDLQHRFLRTNAAYQRLVGYTEDELRDMTTIDLTHPDDIPANWTFRQELLDGSRNTYAIEKRYRTKAGGVVWVRNSVSLVKDGEGKPAFTVGVCEDISLRKRSEADLERQAALNRLLGGLAAAANHAHSPAQALSACLQLMCEHGGWHLASVLQISSQGDGWCSMGTQHHYANPRFEEQFEAFIAHTRQSRRFDGKGLFIRRAINERMPHWIASLNPSGYGPRLTLAREAGIRAAFVFPVIMRDEVVACVEFFSCEVREPDHMLMAVASDIASHLARVMEREIASRANAQLAGIVEASPDAIISRAPDGTVLSWNRAAEDLFGYSAEEAIGAVLRLAPDDRTPEAENNRALVSAGSTLSQFETVRLARDGRRIDVALSTSPARDAAGNLLGIAVIFRDITERKASELAAREYARELQALSQRLAELQEAERRHLSRDLHDRVGQYLTALAINLELIRRQLSADSAERALPRIDDSVRLLEATVDAVNDLMSGLRPPMLEACGLMAALQWHAGEFAKRTGIAVTATATGPIFRMSPSAELTLFRIAQEALTNVAKHAGAHHVLVALHADGRTARLDVIDDGDGFDVNAIGPSDGKAHWGLVSMRERAQAAGGSARVHSRAGQGTHVVAEVQGQA